MSEVELRLQHQQQHAEPLDGLDDLCNRLDQMCYLHSKLTDLVKSFNEIYSFQMLLTFVEYFAKVLSHVKSIHFDH